MKTIKSSFLFAILLAVSAQAHSSTLMSKGFKWSDYERSLKTGEAISAVDMPLPDEIAQHIEPRMVQSGQFDTGAPIVPYIIGGNNASRNEYGEYALILITNAAFDIVGACGGTLIARNKILTAGHCSLERASRYFVIPRFYSFNDSVTASSFVSVSRVAVHPQFNRSNFQNDVGVLTLSRNVSTPVAKVHSGSNEFVGDVGTVIGTGLTRSQPPQGATILQEVAAPIISNQECNRNWERLVGQELITPEMMCAGFSTNGRGSCSGDSGGPLWNNIDGQRAVVGTVSFGLVSCESNRANQTYARLGKFTSFIRSQSPQTQFVNSSVKPTAPTGAIMLLLDESSDSMLPSPPLIDPASFYPTIEDFDMGTFKIKLESELGSIGRGKTYEYTELNSNIRIRRNNFDDAIIIDIDGAGVVGEQQDRPDRWRWAMEAIAPGSIQAGAEYLNATRHPFNSGNGLDVSGNGSGCNRLVGEFRVFEFETNAGEITKLAADFIQRCDTQTGRLRGSIRFDSSKPSNVLVTELPSGNLIPSLPPLTSPGAVMRIVSEAGDYIGQGRDEVYTPNNSTISVGAIGGASRTGIRVQINGDNGDDWHMELARGEFDIDPDAGTPLAAGVYNPAFGYPSNEPFPGVNFSGNGRGCNNFGSFRVFEIEYDNNDVVKLVADFSQRCGATAEFELVGSIYFDITAG